MRQIAAGLILTLSLVALPAPAVEPDDASFETTIRPILVDRCFSCHGGAKTRGGLKVDSREALLKGGGRGPALVPGNPAASLLITAIEHTDDSLQMPPAGQLPADARQALVDWVKRGAPWPAKAGPDPFRAGKPLDRHWAFERVGHPEPPDDPDGWAERPVDRFIAARRRAARLSPVGPADRRTLIRRLTFDLAGLPPTPAEIDEFERDDSADVYHRLVERLLASPRYGERWGRHWMDVVRYADTAGDNADYPVPELALYRDYIIKSFNHDKPYDRFVREQVAGDILARQESGETYAESTIATGFLALARRYATAPYELWHLTMEDAIDTTGRAFLGLTLRCARCHDHKFDPVTQRDYYALYGAFASTKFPYAGSEEFRSKKAPRMNFVPVITPAEAEPKLRAHQARLAELEQQIKKLEPSKDAADRRRLAEKAAELDRLKRPGLPAQVPGAYAVAEGDPIDSAVQRGGDPGNPAAVVPRGPGEFDFMAGPKPAKASGRESGRAQLAQWLTDPLNPLTPRVIVNRIWQFHFGQGLVATSSNFGLRGDRPSHPELLDWLASTFVANGWSIKAIHREIVLSKTYQLASDFDARSASTDPANRCLWRFPRRRLDAEAIRDAMLAVSGLLETRMEGPHPFPRIDDWGWTQHDAFKARYATDRRSVYLMTQRLVKDPYLSIFDGPDTNATTDVRARSTVPLQALYLMNDPFIDRCATSFAGRMIAAIPAGRERMTLAFQLAWGRAPEPAESERMTAFLERAAAAAAREIAASNPELVAWTSLARILLTANEFLYVD